MITIKPEFAFGRSTLVSENGRSRDLMARLNHLSSSMIDVCKHLRKIFSVNLVLWRIFWFLISSIFGSTFASAQTYEQIPGSGFDEGGWVGFALYDTSTGLFDHCSAMTYFENGEIIDVTWTGKDFLGAKGSDSP